jgi:hypothetical protein
MLNRQIKQNKIISNIGKKGYGKTVLTEMLILLNNKPCIIADPRLQYPTDCKRRLFFSSPKQLELWITKIENFKDFYNYKLELICSCNADNFEQLANTAYKMNSFTFCVDEVDMFYNVHTSDKSNINKIIQYGRHNLIDLITTSRRPANIGRNLTAMTDIFYFSRLTEPADLKYFKDIGGERYVDTLQILDKYTFLRLEDDKFSVIKTDKRDIEIIDNL